MSNAHTAELGPALGIAADDEIAPHLDVDELVLGVERVKGVGQPAVVEGLRRAVGQLAVLVEVPEVDRPGADLGRDVDLHRLPAADRQAWDVLAGDSVHCAESVATSTVHQRVGPVSTALRLP